MLRTPTLVLLLFAFLIPASGAHAQAGRDYVVLIGGLSGEPAYAETFQAYLYDTRKALLETYELPPSRLFVLAEPDLVEEDYVDEVATAENIRARFEALAGVVEPADRVFVILFGHGSYDGTHAALNIPRRDLTDADYAELVDGLDAGLVVFVNTSSASAPFIPALSAPGRIVVTATRSGTQRNITRFPRFLVEALAGGTADLDRDGALSVREWFAYAAGQTGRFYEDAGNLPTEDALLDDSGDGEGSRLEELDGGADGNVASVTYLRRGGASFAARAADNPELAMFLLKKEELERSIAEEKSRKSQLSEVVYYARLERLFVELARLNDRIERIEPRP